MLLGVVSVAATTRADIAVAFAARPTLIRRLREGSGAAMIALGLGLAVVRRPVG